jgi:VanZ family protein
MWTIDWEDVIYRSGDVFLPKPIKEFLDTPLYESQNVSFYIHIWTIVHFMSGLLLGYIYLYAGYNKQKYYYNLFVIHTFWEAWQIFIGMSKPFSLTGHNNIIDIFVDTIAFMLGTYIANITKPLF